MMKKHQFILLVLLLSLSSYGQEKPTDMDPGVLETILKTTMQPQELIVKPAAENQVYIQQIGNRNFTSAKIEAGTSNIGLTQIGDDNFIGLIARANTVKGNVNQQGDSNHYFKFVNAPAEDVSLNNLSQNGNNTHFESYGTNSIGNSLQFEMNGDYKTIVVRNFK